MRRGQQGFIEESLELRCYGDVVSKPMESGKTGVNLVSFKNMLLGQGSNGVGRDDIKVLNCSCGCNYIVLREYTGILKKIRPLWYHIAVARWTVTTILWPKLWLRTAI